VIIGIQLSEMDPHTRNLLYRRPELYELIYPEQDEATPQMCLRMFSRYLAVPPRSILDIGCGTGRDLGVLSRYCDDCWGIDYLQQNIDYAKETRPHLVLICGDMRSIRLEKTFDVIQCLGSALMYALSNQDVDATLDTFVAHAHEGSLLIIDVNNASGFFPGGLCQTNKTIEVNKGGFVARAMTTYEFDRRRQYLVRRRVWQIEGQEPAEDYCRYRMFFPAELEYLLTSKGFYVHGIWDNKELAEADLLDTTLYVAATYQARGS
jgi:SAM-dependent methyltransferase